MSVLLTRRQVAEILRVTPTTIDNLVAAGNFPSPIKLTPTPRGRIRWDSADVDAWLEQRKSARETTTATA